MQSVYNHWNIVRTVKVKILHTIQYWLFFFAYSIVMEREVMRREFACKDHASLGSTQSHTAT